MALDTQWQEVHGKVGKLKAQLSSQRTGKGRPWGPESVKEGRSNLHLQWQVLSGLTLANHCGLILLDSDWFGYDLECDSGHREMKGRLLGQEQKADFNIDFSALQGRENVRHRICVLEPKQLYWKHDQSWKRTKLTFWDWQNGKMERIWSCGII